MAATLEFTRHREAPRGQLTTNEAAMVSDGPNCATVLPTAMPSLHGDCGYMRKYAVGRPWADSQVQSIFGGTSEIMKTIIARDLTGLRTWISTDRVQSDSNGLLDKMLEPRPQANLCRVVGARAVA